MSENASGESYSLYDRHRKIIQVAMTVFGRKTKSDMLQTIIDEWATLHKDELGWQDPQAPSTAKKPETGAKK